MNKFNFVRDGGCRLPPGFRFQPTDEEIVFQYLARKTFAYPLPASVIPEISICSFRDPWELPGDSDQDRYFFSNKDMSENPRFKRTRRATCGGFWKETGGAGKRIVGSKKLMPIVGVKKTLVFYKGKYPRATRTDWIMHVYYIALSGETPRSNPQGSLIQIGNWFLCHVFLQKRSPHAQLHERNSNASYNVSTESSDTSSASSLSSSSPYSDHSSVLSEVSSSTADSKPNTSE